LTKFLKSLFARSESYSLEDVIHIEDDYYHPSYKASNELVVYYLAQV